jgi:transposase
VTLPERWPRPRRSSSHAATGSASRCYFFAALPACLVGIEACPTAHYWSRRLGTLGHTVRLLPPSYVKAYLKRSKNDANDAAAICEAVTRPSMRFVPTKCEQQQSGLMFHRSRQLLVCQRTMLSNAIRGPYGRVSAVLLPTTSAPCSRS